MTERAAGFQPKLGTLNDGADKTHGVTVTQRRNFSDFRCGYPDHAFRCHVAGQGRRQLFFHGRLVDKADHIVVLFHCRRGACSLCFLQVGFCNRWLFRHLHSPSPSGAVIKF